MENMNKIYSFINECKKSTPYQSSITFLNKYYPSIYKWLKYKKWHWICLLPFIFYLSYCTYLKITPSGATILGIIGAIFSLLKLKLDQTNYQKSLFEERFAIFKECDEILYCCFHDESKDGEKVNWRLLSQKLDSFYRKSYFLFGKETYAFLTEFRKAVLEHAFGRDSDKEMKIKAEEFLANLLNKQTLSDHFKELKIAHYI
ncbi:hypothetical protein Lche_1104 [Legionella cherrii]|uniref:Uncharacterized protein n=2 Tax=Legionellales TaxID=118969 RepID=A0A0W0S6A9_9GAMM|nr:hypothetical protein Lche_1104 [Legionella cherrii]